MSVRLSVKDFKKMVDSCRRSTSKGDSRPILRLTNICIREGTLRMWSMDGYRVDVNEIKVTSDKDFKASFEQIYIPSIDTECLIDVIDNNLEVTYYPSQFKLTIPQNFQGELFEIDKFIENQQSVEKLEILVRKEFLEDAIKKAGKRERVCLRVSDDLSPVQVLYDLNGLKMTSYVLPIRNNR